MLIGKRFSLRTATIAVDSERVAFILPAGSVLQVVPGPAESDQMVKVLWEGRTAVMFAVDLTARGLEISDPQSIDNADPMSGRAQTLQTLRKDLHEAQERRQIASERFKEVVAEVPSGIPNPDGTDRIR